MARNVPQSIYLEERTVALIKFIAQREGTKAASLSAHCLEIGLKHKHASLVNEFEEILKELVKR